MNLNSNFDFAADEDLLTNLIQVNMFRYFLFALLENDGIKCNDTKCK